MEYRGHGRWEQKRLPVEKPKGLNRMKKIVYKPEYDDGTPAKKKPAKKKATPRRKAKTTSTVKTVAHPKKRLPPMKKPGWLW